MCSVGGTSVTCHLSGTVLLYILGYNSVPSKFIVKIYMVIQNNFKGIILCDRVPQIFQKVWNHLRILGATI